MKKNSRAPEHYYSADLKRSVEGVKRYKIYSKRYAKISAVIFSLVIAAASVCLVFMERPEVSEIEKRELAKKPEFSLESFFSGEYTDMFSAYFSDTVPFRETLVGMNSYLKKLRGISAPTFYGNVSIVSGDDEASQEPVLTVVTPSPEAAGNNNNSAPPAVTGGNSDGVSPDEADMPEVTTMQEEVGNISEFVNNGIIVDGVKMYGENAGIMLFGGNKGEGKRYAEIINKYHEALGENVNVYNLVVPTATEFYLPSKFSKYSSSEKDAINYIYSNLAEGVKGVDAYSALEAHKDEYIYLRTDHHWAPLGAYYAYTAFAEALGMEYHPIEDYEERVKHGFVGSLYGYTGDVTLKNAPEEFHYFIPPDVDYTAYYYNYDTLTSKGVGPLFHEYAEGGNCYGMFLGGDALHTKIVTSVKNGRKIVMFKESYGNAFAPFLVNNFEEVYVIDIRYFGMNAVDYIKQVGATDVLFIDNIFAANTGSLISGIEKLYESKTGTVVVTEATSETTVPVTEENESTKKTKKTKNTKKTKAPAVTEAHPEEELFPEVTTVPVPDIPEENVTIVP